MSLEHFSNTNKPRVMSKLLNKSQGSYAISFIGPLNLYSAHLLTQEYKKIESQAQNITLDISDAYPTFNHSFDTSVVSVVMDINDRLKKKGGTLNLVANRNLQNLSNLLNLERLLDSVILSF